MFQKEYTQTYSRMELVCLGTQGGGELEGREPSGATVEVRSGSRADPRDREAGSRGLPSRLSFTQRLSLQGAPCCVHTDQGPAVLVCNLEPPACLPQTCQ